MRKRRRWLTVRGRWPLPQRRLSTAALAAIVVGLGSAPAEAQEIAYCDMAFFQQSYRFNSNFGTSVTMAGERKKQGILLTSEMAKQRATGFHKIPIPFAPGASFFVHFRVRISGAGANAPPNGADGMVFTIQNDPGGDPLGVGKEGKGAQVVGAAGAGMSYEGITQSIAVEFDIYKHTERQDPDGNHIALLLGGRVNHTDTGTAMGKPLMGMPPGSTVTPSQPVLLNLATQPLEATAPSYDTRDVWIDYECSAPDVCTLRVYMTWNIAATASTFADVKFPNTLPAKPAAPVMVIENLLDVQDYLNSDKGFAGFTASTSTAMAEHLVTYWVMSRTPFSDTNKNNLEDVCECDVIAGACGGSLPFCDTENLPGICRECLATKECQFPKPACDNINLYEGATGACVECVNDAHCIHPNELYCNLSTKECTNKCTNADMCSEDKWCDNPLSEPFGGDCVPDLANGEPIPKASAHMPPLDGVCTPDAAPIVCASRVCDEQDNLCGYAAGTRPCDASTAHVVCRSGVCGANGACGCTADNHCGDTASGKVCDRTSKATLNQCVDGCRGSPEDSTSAVNSCPAGLECTSSTETIGECVEPVVVSKPDIGGKIDEETGCAQSGAAYGGRAGQYAIFGMLAALAGHLARRRLKH